MGTDSLFHFVYESAQDSIFVKNDLLQYMQVNPAMLKLLNLPVEEVIGKTDLELFGTETGTKFQAIDRRVLNGEIVITEDVFDVNDRQVVFSVVKTPLRDENGNIIGVCGIARDITEQKAAHQLLHESEQRLRTLFDNASDLIQAVSHNGKILYANRAWKEALGYSDEECQNLRIYDIFAPDCREHCLSLFDRVMHGERLGQVTTTFVTKKGQPLEVEGAISPNVLDGQVISTVGIFRDIGERKRIENALRESEERYRKIFETAAVSIWEEDFYLVKVAVNELRGQGVTDFRKYLDEHPQFLEQAAQHITIRDVNEATLRMFGAESKEHLLGNITKIFVPETQDILREEIIAIAEGKTYFEGETVNRTLSGEKIDVLLTISFPTETEKFHSVLVSLMDIRSRKQAERESEIQRVYFQQLFENAPVAIAMLDKRDCVKRVNRAFQKLFGYTPEEAVDRPINDLIIPDALVEEATGLSMAVFGGSVIQKETYRMRKDRTVVPVQVYAAPIEIEGEIVGGYAMYVDISDRKLKEQKLEYISSHDALTGLFNRAFFESELRRLEDHQYMPVSILVGDVDGLKLTNDRLGHAMGDELLRAAGQILKKTFRSLDVVARIGGDEFAVILPNTNVNVAERLLQRVNDGIKSYNDSHPLLPLSISMGVATAISPMPLNQLLQEADRRMYAQKEMNREKKKAVSKGRENV